MKCAYNKCKFNGEVEKDEAVILNKKYYHAECLKEKQNKEEIRKIYLEYINPAETMKLLNSAISNLVDVKKIDSNFLLFVVQQVIKKKMKINSPMGLHYYINNQNIKELWQLAQMKAQKQTINLENIKSDEVIFEYKPQNNSNWGKITR